MKKHVFTKLIGGLLAGVMVISSVAPAWAAENPEEPVEEQVVIEEECEDAAPVEAVEEKAEESAAEEIPEVEEEAVQEEEAPVEEAEELPEEEPAEEEEEDSVKLAGKVSLEGFEIAGLPKIVYIDDAQMPVSLPITVKSADKELKEGVDYTVKFEGNEGVGTARAIVTGKGGYEGTLESTFPIRYNLANAAITSIASIKYNGKEREPKIVVMYCDKELIKDQDYTVSYSNNINAGKKAVVKVEGIGDYAGTLSRKFKISRVYNKITVPESSIVRPYSVKKQSLRLKPAAIDPATTFTYKSDTSKVKVSAKGTVVVAKEFIGTAKITITASETKNCAAKSKTITITVNPPMLGTKAMIQHYMTRNPDYKANKKLTVKGLMLHSVNCPVPSAMSFINRWDSPSYNRASIHGFIDANTGEVYQTLPWTVQAGHCYKGPKGSGNKTHIGVEMCEASCVTWVSWNKIRCSNYSKARASAKRTYKSAVELFAMLCVQFDLDPMAKGVVISHVEGWELGIASDHGDPENLWKALGLNYTMNGFRKAVKKAMAKYK